MTPDQTAILASLLSLVQRAYHTQDSALQALKELPDWQTRFETARDDPARINKTMRTLAPIQKLADGIRAGVVDDEEWLQLLSEVERLTGPED
jgi:hypothetical protein